MLVAGPTLHICNLDSILILKALSCRFSGYNLLVFVFLALMICWCFVYFKHPPSFSNTSGPQNWRLDKLGDSVVKQVIWSIVSAHPTAAPRICAINDEVGIVNIWGLSPPDILQIHSLHQVATGNPSHVPLRCRGIIIAIFRGPPDPINDLCSPPGKYIWGKCFTYHSVQTFKILSRWFHSPETLIRSSAQGHVVLILMMNLRRVLKDFRWFICHHSSVVESAAHKKFSNP